MSEAKSKSAANAGKKTTTRNSAAKQTKPRAQTASGDDRSGAVERIDQYILDAGGWKGAMLAEIRELIHEVDPDVIEEWKWMGTPVWSHEGMYANANAFKDKVKLTLHYGAKLSDPDNLLNSSLNGNQRRAIDWFEGDKIERRALKALLREAIAFNETHSVPKSRGSNA